MARQPALDRTVLEAALIGLAHQRSEIDAKVAEVRRRLRGAGPSEAAPSAPSARRKRVLSPAARKRIADATKKRWAEYRAKKAAASAPAKSAAAKSASAKSASAKPAAAKKHSPKPAVKKVVPPPPPPPTIS